MERQGGNTSQATTTAAKHNHWSTMEIAIKSISSLVLILLIVALGVDKLNTGTVKGFDQNGNFVKADVECKWKETGSDDNLKSYKDLCDAGLDDACDLESPGEVWVAFGILAIFAQTAAVASMFLVLLKADLATISKEALMRAVALGVACLCVLIQWSVWQAKGCTQHEGDELEDGWNLGPSMIVAIIAWILSLVATALQAANLTSIQRVSSVKPAGADIEAGAIRS